MSQMIKVLCPQCGHMAWHTVEPEVIQPEYDITDAQADAAVLSDLTGFAGDAIDEIRDEILNRLHSFYCGTGAE